MLAIARTFSLLGVDAREVSVEVDVRRGLSSFSLVGLPDAAVRESRERVRAALVNSGFEFPNQRITVNLAPADLRKAGPGFDLAIAAALLAASRQLAPEALAGRALAGELGLDGAIRSVPGTLAMAEEARRLGLEAIVVAAPSGPEAALALDPPGSNGTSPRPRVVPIERLEQLSVLGGPEEPPPPKAACFDRGAGKSLPDLADLRGQAMLRRALEITAAGGHGLLLLGPPGAGKSLAARRIVSILPPLSRQEAIEVARIESACGRPAPGARRPFRAPHHTISAAGLVGGGNPPRPGEVTLAHRGVLFLDELGEFSRPALEALRQPLEDGRVAIARARHTIELPCRFMLIAAANPCPCGRGSDSGDCDCDPGAVRRYKAKVSGALADRLDILLGVEQPSAEEMGGAPGEGSVSVRERVVGARERQERRLGPGRTNAEITLAETRAHCRLDPEARAVLVAGHASLGLSGRGHDRVLRVARTIGDLAGSSRIEADHVREALMLRRRTEAG